MGSRRGFSFSGRGKNLENARTTKSCFQALRGKENQRTPGLSELATQQDLLKHLLCRQCILWVQIKGDCNFLLVFFSLVCPSIFCVKQLNVHRSRAAHIRGILGDIIVSKQRKNRFALLLFCVSLVLFGTFAFPDLLGLLFLN